MLSSRLCLLRFLGILQKFERQFSHMCEISQSFSMGAWAWQLTVHVQIFCKIPKKPQYCDVAWSPCVMCAMPRGGLTWWSQSDLVCGHLGCSLFFPTSFQMGFWLRSAMPPKHLFNLPHVHHSLLETLPLFLRHLIKNVSWLEEKLDDYNDDDYVLFDCPGKDSQSAEATPQ